MITKEAIEAACAVLNERDKGNAINIPDVVAMLTAAFAAMPGPAVKVKPLGKEFEEAIFSDVETLYEATALTPATDLASENERLRAAHDDGVKFGIALSIAFLLRDRDESVIAEEWWDATGMTIEACERIGLDEYDLDPIRAALERT